MPVNKRFNKRFNKFPAKRFNKFPDKLPSYEEHMARIQNKKFSLESKNNLFMNSDVCGIIFEFSELYEQEQLIDSLIRFANYFVQKINAGDIALAAKMEYEASNCRIKK